VEIGRNPGIYRLANRRLLKLRFSTPKSLDLVQNQPMTGSVAAIMGRNFGLYWPKCPNHTNSIETTGVFSLALDDNGQDHLNLSQICVIRTCWRNLAFVDCFSAYWICETVVARLFCRLAADAAAAGVGD